jgi:hypothetical protein
MKTYAISCLVIVCLLTGVSRLYAAETNTYNAIFIDRQGVTTGVLNVQYTPDYLHRDTMPQDVLYGWRGHAQITIPWKNIRRIDFIDSREGFNAMVTLRNNIRVGIRIEAKTTEYIGKNSFGGTFRIRTEHIRAIIFE